MSACTLYPAIDVRDGRVVRLLQGDYAQETRYAGTPLALAEDYAQAGAGWLHLVDLDAARAGGYTLGPLLASIKAATSLRVQTGGGVRSEQEVESILAAGADRVVIGSMAVRETGQVLAWIRRFGSERITIALDVRQDADGLWTLPVAGWTQDSGIRFAPLVQRFAEAGVRHLLCTDIARDGMLVGPSIALYRQLSAWAPDMDIQASGGIRSVDDIQAAAAAGCRGAVLGKALLEGRFTLEQALSGAVSC